MTLDPTPLELAAALLFGLAVLHTFCTRWFEHLARTRPRHAGVWHLLGEVETVFGLWAVVLLVVMTALHGWTSTAEYVQSRHFVEPMFVFVIMVVSASRPVVQVVTEILTWMVRKLPLHPGLSAYSLTLSMVPLLGSLITEPAAMTIAALLLRDALFSRSSSARFKYATLGVLFVNVSIGGTLTNFAAPPVLMVAAKWEWSSAHMLATFGWKAVLAVVVNSAAATFLFRRHVMQVAVFRPTRSERVPPALVALNVAILAGIIASSHTPEIFVAALFVFLAFAEAYPGHHDRLVIREALLVSFFLAGLVVLGGQQQWWLQSLIGRLDGGTLFSGAAGLTAITDNAALTYLGSLVDGLTNDLRYALVAGAVTGGGLTVIANAPNPAGFAILRETFEERAISPLGLFIAALPPTAVAALAMWGLKDFVLTREALQLVLPQPGVGAALPLLLALLLVLVLAGFALYRRKEQ